ncbi:acyl dehydratase [Mycolicibacterium sp. (ex Dasyatis americana)]|nr:acyl dehydratase [Mycolicibacterium sp. (ex Dasyatis americana)]
MTVQPNETEQFGVLTDEAIARSRRRLGVPQPEFNAPHNYEVTPDGTRHFGYGYGDDNPLYCDPEYAATTRWGALIAQPNFLYTMGEDAAPKPDAETKALLKGDPFAGLGSYQAVMEFEWWRPLYVGDRCRVLHAQVGVEPKPSAFGGRTVHVTHDYLYANGKGEMHAIQRGTWINAERHTSKKRAKETLHQPPYTDEQVAEVDAAYAAEVRRGAEPRYFEDVEVGDTLQTRAKGPLTTTDIVIWHIGWGMQLTPPGSFGISARVRRKAPGLYPRNGLNVPDTVQRLHWEPARARELGLPNSYDYGGLRETWLTHLITDWMGDDAWLWKLRCEHRKFNYIGDLTWVRGEVADKRAVDGRNEVHLRVWCENQRGETTTPGTAVVLLPTRDAAVTLPEPPAADLEGVLAYELEHFALTSRAQAPNV